MSRIKLAVLSIVWLSPGLAGAQSFEPGTCYRAQFCGTFTGRNTNCPDGGSDVVGECVIVEYDVRSDGVVVNQFIGSQLGPPVVAVDMFIEGCVGVSQFRSNGIRINDVEFNGGEITGTADVFGTDPNIPDFEMVTGSLSATSLNFTIAGGLDRFEGIVVEFESTFCNQDNCGDCNEPFGNGEPPPPELPIVRWDTNDGDYGLASLWDPEEVPGEQQTALFDVPDTYGVAMTTHTTGRARINRGTVDFSGGTYNLTDIHLGASGRSLQVGTSNGDAFLTLTELDLNTIHSAIALPAGSNAGVTVRDGSIWDNTGRLSVGLEGIGFLDILPGGTVFSAESRIGDLAGSSGTVTVLGLPDDDLSTPRGLWDTANLAVGLDGEGTLIIRDGTVVSDTVSIGREATGEGFVSVIDFGEWTTGDIDIGGNGMGELTIDGGEVTSGTAVIGNRSQSNVPGQGFVVVTNGLGWNIAQLTVAKGIESSGFLDINQGSRVSVDGELRVGTDGGFGTVHVGLEPESLVNQCTFTTGACAIGHGGEGILSIGGLDDVTTYTSGGALIGAIPESDGEVHVIGTDWIAESITVGSGDIDGIGTLRLCCGANVNVGTDVLVQVGGEIQGNGTITVLGDATNNGGTITPGISGIQKELNGFIAKQVSQEERTLTLNGNFTMNGGLIEAQVDGTAAGSFDKFVVTGDAAINNATIKMRFGQGFTPSPGNEFPVVVAQGVLNALNVNVETEGLAPGRDVNLMVMDGMLVAVTTETSNDPPTPTGCAAATSSTNRGTLLGDAILLIASGLCLFKWHQKENVSTG